MDFERQTNRVAERCRGIIKKLFPAKRYGFAICECAVHRGEAHFNYSELDLDEEGRNALCVGWRLEFEVSKQERPTNYCEYRASCVRPVEVMVVQCELLDVNGDTGHLMSRELGGRRFAIKRDHFNGKFSTIDGHRRSTCRAAITFEQLKLSYPTALHCSQDTPSTTQRPETPPFQKQDFERKQYQPSVDLIDDETSFFETSQHYQNRDQQVVPLIQKTRSFSQTSGSSNISLTDHDPFQIENSLNKEMSIRSWVNYNDMLSSRKGNSDRNLFSIGSHLPFGLSNSIRTSSPKKVFCQNSTDGWSPKPPLFEKPKEFDCSRSSSFGWTTEDIDYNLNEMSHKENKPTDFGGYHFPDFDGPMIKRSNSFSPDVRSESLSKASKFVASLRSVDNSQSFLRSISVPEADDHSVVPSSDPRKLEN